MVYTTVLWNLILVSLSFMVVVYITYRTVCVGILFFREIDEQLTAHMYADKDYEFECLVWMNSILLFGIILLGTYVSVMFIIDHILIPALKFLS